MPGRSWLKGLPRVLGITASIPIIPQIGLAFPVVVPIMGVLLPLRSIGLWSRDHSRLIALAIVGMVSLFVSATVNGTGIGAG